MDEDEDVDDLIVGLGLSHEQAALLVSAKPTATSSMADGSWLSNDKLLVGILAMREAETAKCEATSVSLVVIICLACEAVVPTKRIQHA
jgi:hypothetical protein